MCWVLRVKRDALLAATGVRLIFEVWARDARWRAQPTGNRYEGKNVPVWLCMEVYSGAWVGRIRTRGLAGCNGVPAATP